MKKPDKLWKLKKSVYGMSNAGRKWYFKVEKVLTGIGCKKSRYDHCLFTYKVDVQLAGILLLFIDDIFYAGTNNFIENVMDKVAKEFMVGRTEESVFTYVRLNIERTAKGITLDQIEYIKERMEPATLRGGDNKRPLEKEDRQAR